MKTVRQVISGNAGLSLNNVVFVSDRGYSDAKNIKDCLRNKLGFLFNVQCEMPGSFAQELIDEERENLRDLNRMDWLTKVFQITKEINWTFEPDLVQGQVSSKKTKESRYFTGTSISIDYLLRTLGRGLSRESIAYEKRYAMVRRSMKTK